MPVVVGRRLFLPESWTGETERIVRARVPEEHWMPPTKPEIALEETDRIGAAGAGYGCVVAGAGHGLSAPFRQALRAGSSGPWASRPGRRSVRPTL